MTRWLSVLALVLTFHGRARAEDRFVGGSGDPYATIGDALNDAVDGDVVIVRAGTYDETLVTRAAGVTIRADAGAEVIVTDGGPRLFDVRHPRTTLEGFVLDGQYGGRVIRIDDGAHGTVLRDMEIRNGGNHCVDLRVVEDVLIEGSLIHHCLASSSPMCASDGCRNDAHGIVGGQAQRLVIRNTEIHTFSGDAVQLDSDRGTPQWSVTIEGCLFWSAPLESAVGGYAAGVNPAENAIDTKTSDTTVPPAILTVIDTVAFGFGNALISLGAAFNIKENVVATFDRVTVYDSDVAFRLRGMTSRRPRGARVTIDNAVLYDLDRAIRYEDGLGMGDIVVRHVTFGSGVMRPFEDVSALGAVTVSASNVLVLAGSLPAEAMGPGSMAVDASVFVDAVGHDYHLAAGSGPIDVGEAGPVDHDRDNNARPFGSAPDVGAYEHCGDMCVPPPDAGVPPGRDAGPGGDDAGAGADGGATSMDAGSSRGDAGPGGGGSDGCGCRTIGGSSRGSLIPLVVTLLWWRRRRR